MKCIHAKWEGCSENDKLHWTLRLEILGSNLVSEVPQDGGKTYTTFQNISYTAKIISELKVLVMRLEKEVEMNISKINVELLKWICIGFDFVPQWTR